MLRKLTIILAAAASLSVAALAPSTASAKPFGGWGWGWGGYHHHFGGFGLRRLCRRRLLRDPPRADAVWLPLPHRERLFVLTGLMRIAEALRPPSYGRSGACRVRPAAGN